jgi:hypothetical protein
MLGMNASRVAAWMFGAAVLGAWLASAASDPGPRLAARASSPPAVNPMDHLAADVEAQTGRLRQRLDAAPTPQAPLRNPFTFAPRAQPVPRQRVVAATVPSFEAPAEPAEPPMDLIGIAEKKSGEGVVRTAMISNQSGDLLMVTAGQRILGIYDVTAIGHDAIELKHATTGAVRRLALR